MCVPVLLLGIMPLRLTQNLKAPPEISEQMVLLNVVKLRGGSHCRMRASLEAM